MKEATLGLVKWLQIGYNEIGGSAMLKSIGQVVAVLAIVAVVAAVLFPILGAHPGRPYVTSCASNEKQLGIALLSYLTDYDERLPPPYRGGVQGWAGRINPYVKNAGLFRCPGYTRHGLLPFLPDRTVADTQTQAGSAAGPVSYAYNSNLKQGSTGFASANATNPNQTVLLFEVEGGRAQVDQDDEGTQHFTATPSSGCLSPAGDGSGTIPQWGWLGSGPSPLKYATGPIGGRTSIVGEGRHTDGSNYLGLDGHVRWLKPAQVSGGATNPSSNGKQDQPSGAAAGTQAGYVLTFSPR